MQPAHWYFTAALPKALLAAFPLAALGAIVERRVRPSIIVALTYVAVYSSAAQGGAPSYTCLRNPFTAGCLDGLTQPTQMLLCHCLCPFSGGYLQGNMLLKQGRLPVQVRFIFPVLLLFNIAAAAGLARLHQNRSKGQRERLAWWAALALLAASTAASFGMAAVSQANYPGGHALYRLHTIVDAAPEACRLPSTYTHAISGLYAWPHSDAAPLDHRRLLG